MVWIAAVVAAVFGIITLVGVMPFLRKRIIAAEADADSRCAAGLALGLGLGLGGGGRPAVRGRQRAECSRA